MPLSDFNDFGICPDCSAYAGEGFDPTTPSGSTRDFWSGWDRDYRNYTKEDSCEICNAPITNDAELCGSCAAKLREQMRRFKKLMEERNKQRLSGDF